MVRSWRWQTMLLSGKRLALLLLFILGSPALAEAQSAPQHFAAAELLPPPIAVSTPRTDPSRLRSSSPFSRQHDIDPDPSRRIASSESPISESEARENPTAQNPTYEYQSRSDQGIAGLVPLQSLKTSFGTESRVPVGRIWGTPLQLNLSAITLRNGNITQGPLTANEWHHPPPLSRSTDLFGLGVSIPLGRHAQPEGSKDLWRNLVRVARGG
jgi:hypothetical protein